MHTRRRIGLGLAAALALIIGVVVARAHPFAGPLATAPPAVAAATATVTVASSQPRPTPTTGVAEATRVPARRLPPPTKTRRKQVGGQANININVPAPRQRSLAPSRNATSPTLRRRQGQRPIVSNVPALSTPAAPAAPPTAPAATSTAPKVALPAAAPTTRAAPVAPPFDPNTPSGSIVIPHLGIQAPIYVRGIDSTRNLPIAPGYAVTHYWFSAPMGQAGNYVIYGHDDIEGQIFRYLPNMRVGDTVYLSNGKRRYLYRVTGSQVVSPNDVTVMAPTRAPTLTMISCVPYGVDTQRIVVTAALV